MHSWRVLLLPYLERKDLYSQYDFDEPWDGPNNSKLHGTRVRYFESPSGVGVVGETSCVAIVGMQTVWPGAKTTKNADIKDGLSNAVLVAEIHNSGIH